jgi:hypothetical protein
METVNWNKFADIVVNLQLKNEYYSLIKYFDDDLLDHIRNRFDEKSAMKVANNLNALFDEVMQLQANQIPPESKQGQAVAKAWWEIVTEFTGGDASMLPGLIKIAENVNSWGDESWRAKWSLAEVYIQKVLEIYFANLGFTSLEEIIK